MTLADTIPADQTQVVAFLADPASHGQGGPVETVTTHISTIFLVGDRALKMKRAVSLPYADFSTPALRLAACVKEVELNAPTAPGLYLGVRRIMRRADGTFAFGGEGELADAVVEMERFDQSALFDAMAQAGTLTPALMTETARMIARFHRAAPVAHGRSGSAVMRAVLDINRAAFATGRLFARDEVERLDAALRAALARHADALDRREAAGKVRRCHGDLHLHNICLLDGEPRLFDCLEFNEELATVDVLYDFAFLLMDLWHRDLADLANLAMNRYLDEADDEDGFSLLPFFMAVRAAVRAHVAATQAGEGGPTAEARAYFDLAGTLLRGHAARLVAIGGLSGSGKTTVAEALAAHVGAPPGARVVESDRIRKAMHGVTAETRLPEAAYSPAMSQQVYGEMERRAAALLAQGGSVVCNAVFDRQDDRARIRQAADDGAAPFLGLWLEAAPDLLRRRVAARAGGPSDATVDILARQLQRDPGAIDWHRLDAGRDTGRIVDDILALTAQAGSRSGGPRLPS